MRKLSLTLPRGSSFELSDLTIVLAWSEFHDLRMVVKLDHCIGDEEHEEVLAFYPPDLKFRRWSMWRTNEDIMVQPTVGRTMHFTSVAGALETLDPCSRRSGQSREHRADAHRWVNPPHLQHAN